MKRKFDTFEIIMGLVVVGALLAVFFMSGKSSSGVVLLDVERAFRDLGRDIVHIQESKKRQGALEMSLANLRTELENNLAIKKKEYGDSPTEEQQTELSRLERELTYRIDEASAKNQREMEMLNRQMIAEFYQEIKPAAEKIAAERGANIVVNSNAERIVAFDYSVDITDDVVQSLQQALQPSGLEGASTVEE